MAAGRDMPYVQRGAHGLRSAGQSPQNVVRALVSEFLLEVMVMDTERQPLTRKSLVDFLQHVTRRVAGDIARAQELGKPDGTIEILIVFDGRRVVRHAVNPRAIEFALRGAAHLDRGRL